MLPRPPRSPLFPYTTLFRSLERHGEELGARDAADHRLQLVGGDQRRVDRDARRSEEHTSELQSLRHLVCRLLLEKKKNKKKDDSNLHQHRDSTCNSTAVNIT